MRTLGIVIPAPGIERHEGMPAQPAQQFPLATTVELGLKLATSLAFLIE
jgi:hypothetical protein